MDSKSGQWRRYGELSTGLRDSAADTVRASHFLKAHTASDPLFLYSYNLLEDQGTLNTPLITHARHRTHLESALLFLDAFLEACESCLL